MEYKKPYLMPEAQWYPCDTVLTLLGSSEGSEDDFMHADWNIPDLNP